MLPLGQPSLEEQQSVTARCMVPDLYSRCQVEKLHIFTVISPLGLLLFCKINVTVTNVGGAGDLVQFIDEVDRFRKQTWRMLLSLEYCQPLLGLMTEEVAQCHVGSHYVQDSPANCCCSWSPSCLTARIVFWERENCLGNNDCGKRVTYLNEWKRNPCFYSYV